MKVAVGNIRALPVMRQRWVESDTRALACLAQVCMGAEIKLPRYKEAWTRIFRRAGADRHLIHTPNPIAVRLPGSWRPHGHDDVRKMHEGRAMTSPARFCGVIRYHHRGGLRVAFMSTHYVSGAWNRKPKLHKAWRREKWNEHHAGQVEWINELVDQGYTVVTGGDFNRTGRIRFHDRQQTLARAGLMHLYVVPADGVTVKVHRQEHLGRRDGIHTDHQLIAASFTLTQEKP